MIEMLLISLGLRRARSAAVPVTPSITTRGSAELIELTPLIFSAPEEPGLPLEVVTLSPGTAPCSILATECESLSSRSLLLMVDTAPVRFTFF